MTASDVNVSPGPPNRPPVSLDRNGHCLTVCDDVDLNGLDHAARTCRIVSRQDASYGCSVSGEVDSLLQPLDRMRRPNAGLLPLFQHVAEQQGRRIRVSDTAPILQLPFPVRPVGVSDNRIPDFVRRNERGLIRIGADADSIDVAGLLADAFPRTRIAILSSHRSQLEKAGELLRAWLPQRRIADRLPHDEEGHWVALSTFTDAAEGPLEKCHLVLLLDAVQATHARAEAALAAMDARFRLFGVLQSKRRLAPSEQDRLVASFGVELIDVPQPNHELAEVRVVRLDLNGPRLEADTAGMPLQRLGYWQHPVRNRKIVQLAKQLRNGDTAALCQFHGMAEWQGAEMRRPQRVSILVHSCEHALALARQLPGWPIFTGSPAAPVDQRGLDSRQQRLLAARRSMWLTGDQQIVTLDGASQLRPGCTDTVIWAGGGQHAPVIPRRWLLHPGCTGRRLLVVDFTDQHHAELARWSRQRRHQYQDRDWFDAGVDDRTGRIQRFLRQRPKGPEGRRAAGRHQ